MTRFDFFWKFIEQPKRTVFGWWNHFRGHDNAYLIQKEVNRHRYELGTDGFCVYMLLGWTDQEEDDYYWLVYHPDNGIQRHSCVGGFSWLKGALSGFEYYRCKHWWDINTPPMKDIMKKAFEMGINIK